ncbi:hydrophobin-319 [Pholiota molesta]|nr:hydrophobin-319 [Pholiota molesta]
MQFTLSALTALAIVTLAVATPARRNDAPPASECNTGSVQCCDSTSTASNPVTALLLGSLGIPIGSVTGIIGLTCSPSLASASVARPARLLHQQLFNGVVALGCTPVNLNL